jgi:hypothetical protein
MTTAWLALVVVAACSRQAQPPAAHRPVTSVIPGKADIGGASVSLPKQIGDWIRPDASRKITAESIFDYMDGAGELYLAYQFDHLDVFEYKAADASLGTVLVEIYSMRSSADAFGLLSTDWGGDRPPFDPVPAPRQSLRAVPPTRALYGGGLLRMWVDDRYVRVLASRETDDSRSAVFRLGDAIARGGAGGPGTGAAAPGSLRGLDVDPDPARPLRPDRTCFFRSHLVLNSQYFLASQDILGLGLDVAAVTAEYAPAPRGERPVRLVLVRYPSPDRARAALASFCQSYLPDSGSRATATRGEARVEHGWVGWKSLDDGRVTIVLDAPERSVARHFADVVSIARSDAWM